MSHDCSVGSWNAGTDAQTTPVLTIGQALKSEEALRVFQEVLRQESYRLSHCFPFLDRDDAEQEAAAAMLPLEFTFRSLLEFRGLVRKACRYRMLDFARKESTRFRYTELVRSQREAGGQGSPPPNLQVLQAILALPPDLRLVIQHTLAARSLTEIGTVLGVSRKVIARRYHKAIKLLKANLL